MIILSYGFKKPELKDLGPVVFPALEDNWQQVNDHDHDGLNSAKIDIDANLPLQTGNAGKFLTTNGTTSSWASIALGEVNTASNVGGGNGLFKQKSGVDLEFKTLVAGANTTITPVGDTLVIASSYVDTGEVNTASNLGGGNGIFKSKVGVDLQFKSLVAGSNMSITQVGDTLVFASSYVDTGEVNTASNVGGGAGLFKQKTGVDLEFKTLVAGANMSITPVGDTFVLAASVPAAGANTSLSNLAATAINQNLIFDGNPQVAYQSPSTTTWTIGTANTTAPIDINSSHNLLIKTGDSSFGSTGTITIKTPQATNSSWGVGVVRSGDIIIDVGISANVPTITPGKFKIKDQSNGGGTTGVVGHVWTQTAADGSGQWAAPAAGGEVNTASNVGAGFGLFKQKTGVNLEFYSLVAGTGISVTQVGDTVQISSTVTAGANTTLSNLGVTAINSSLVSAADNTLDLGSSTNRWFNIHGQVISGYSQIGWRDFATGLPILNMFATAFLTATNGAFISGPHQNLGVTYDAFGFRGRNANAGVASLPIIIATGNGGTGANSGGILFQTGTSTATRGKIQFKDGTEGTAGHVWTSIDTNGNGRWQAPAGASITAGMYAEYYSSTGVNYTGGLIGTWYNLPMDTLVEDTHSIYNPVSGIITIPPSYVGTAHGTIRVVYVANSASQIPTLIRTGLWKSVGGFQKYGASISNYPINVGGTDYYQDKKDFVLETTFQIKGVASEQFYVQYFASGATFLAGGAGTTRIEISFHPK